MTVCKGNLHFYFLKRLLLVVHFVHPNLYSYFGSTAWVHVLVMAQLIAPLEASTTLGVGVGGVVGGGMVGGGVGFGMQKWYLKWAVDTP